MFYQRRPSELGLSVRCDLSRRDVQPVESAFTSTDGLDGACCVPPHQYIAEHHSQRSE